MFASCGPVLRYTGLWFEMIDNVEDAKKRILAAAVSTYGTQIVRQSFGNGTDFMFVVASVHGHCRGWAAMHRRDGGN